jgi:hypothetical protein
MRNTKKEQVDRKLITLHSGYVDICYYISVRAVKQHVNVSAVILLAC